jgi:formylglycine-generating enzyme required for sulfatase activity
MVPILPDPRVHGGLRPFLIDVRELTNAEYKRYCDATGARTPRHWKYRRVPEGKDDHPVVNVTALEAEAYAAWAGKRMPSIEEWRAAAQGADARRYPWGDGFDSARLNSRDHGVGGTLPAGRLTAGASPFGVLDLAGNVAEWTSSLGEGHAGRRVIAGGHFDSPAEACTTIFLMTQPQDHPDMGLGFRCARSLP